MSCIRKNYNKKIFTEAHNLSDHLIGCFLKDKDLKKIHVIRNFKNSNLKDNRIQYHYVSENNPQDRVFQLLDIKDMILIAPESKQINIKIFKKLNKKFNLLNSNYNVHKFFSSKKKTYEILSKKRIPAVKIERKVTNNSNFCFITKPVYGAGSENVNLIKSKLNIKNDKHLIIQKYYTGIKGSFTMICKGKSVEVLSCSEQIIDIKNKRIFQKGLIIGGLEKYREDFRQLSKKIISIFPGFFGFIGVDVIKIENVWHILEINTRFTSSLLGIESAYGNEAVKKITNLYLNKKIDTKKIELKKITKVLFN